MKGTNSKNKKLHKNKKGFSLVELLAVIIIVGIISTLTITGVSRYINKARIEKNNQSKKDIAMSTRLYMQSNTNELPKLIGDSKIVKVGVLREKNYLKEDVKNADGEDCMEKSFVRVYMLDESEYSYTTYLYCGDDEVPDEVDVPQPFVMDFKFTGGKKSGNKFNDVKDAKFNFKIKGAEKDDTVGIYSYNYVIYVRTKESEPYTEVFNSGTLKGGLEPLVAVNSQPLSSYMSLTGYNNVRVDITAINEQGGKLEYSTSTGEYEDKESPICGETEGEAKDDNDWVNKETYGADGNIPSGQLRAYPGRVSVNCSDGAGSGCKRDRFTRSWPNNSKSISGIDYKLGARWSYVLLEDNAETANTTKCYVRANVDVQAPEVTVNVYRSKDKKLIKSLTVKDSSQINEIMPEGTIASDEYQDVTGTSDEKWMNLENFGTEGIYIDVDIKDNLYLYSYEWKVNNPYVAGSTVERMIASTASIGNVAGEGGTKANGTFSSPEMTDNPTNDTELKSAEHGALSGTIKNLRIVREGKRYGQLKVCDKANNCTTIHIYANIDITPPLVPETSYEKIKSGSSYYPADISNYLDHEHWSNEFVRSYINGQREDKETQSTTKVTLSGWDHFTYYYKRQNGKNNGQLTWAKPISDNIQRVLSGTSRYGFDIRDQGTHIVAFNSCDKAGNCSKNSVDDYVKVDTIVPTCDIVTKYEENGTDITSKAKATGSTNGSGWLKIGQQVTLSHSCEDKDDKYSSGCNADDYHNRQKYLFNADINTNAAGANGYNTTYGSGDNSAGGHVVDYAGNISKECPKMTVKIDHVAPTCKTNITWPQGNPLHPTTAGKPETGWLGLVNGTGPGKKTANVAKVCNDPTSKSGLMTGVHSTCDDNGQYDSTKMNKKNHAYDFEMWITTAGAEGKGNGGQVIDIAGNTTNCPADRTVKIDYTAPVCNTKIEYGLGTSDANFTINSSANPNAAGWLGWHTNVDTIREMAKVSQVCTDPNGTQKSGCYGDMKYSIYWHHMYITNAGAVRDGDNGDVFDTAGNKTNCNSAKMYTVKIDQTRPVCEVKVTSTGKASNSGNNNEIARNWAYENYDGRWLGVGAKVSIQSTCTSAEDGRSNSSGCATDVTKDYTSEISTTQATSGGNNVAFYVYDIADNRAADECERKTVKIDLSGPTCTTESRYAKGEASNNSAYYDASSTGFNGWLDGSHSVRVRSQCTADKLRNGLAGSGCLETDIHGNNYRASSGTVLNSYKGANTDGTAYTIYDAVGNPTTCGKKQVKIDNQAPRCTLTSKTNDGASYGGTWTNKSVTVSRTCNDSTGSGCDEDSRSEKSHSYSTTSYWTTTSAGAVSERDSGTVTDNVGNKTTCPANKTVKLDVTKPSCTIDTSNIGKWTNKNAVIQGNCSDTGSGCKTTARDLKVTYSSDTNGSYSYNKTLTDKAGNTNVCKGGPYTVKVQKTKPTCKTYKELWSWYDPNGVTVNVNCYPASSPSSSAPLTSCGGSGSISTNFGLYNSTANLKNNKTYYVKDEAGNTGSCSVTVYSKYQNRTRSCSTCKSCSSAGCASYSSWYWQCTNTKHSSGTYWKNCKSSDADGCLDAGYKYNCQHRTCDSYNRSCSTCGGCSSGLGSWSDWSDGSHSEGWSGSTQYERRTVYY